MGSTKRYGVIVGNSRVMTVIAENEEAAKEKARHQLQKPGRRSIFRQWQDGGERVKKE